MSRARFLVGRWERRSAEVGIDSGIGSDIVVVDLTGGSCRGVVAGVTCKLDVATTAGAISRKTETGLGKRSREDHCGSDVTEATAALNF